jgi:predicted ATPase
MDFIEIKGYKSICNVSVQLNPINILIGANGAGKSNFLSLFEFLNHLYERKLKQYIALEGGEEKFLHKGSKITNKIEVKIKFGLNTYSFVIEKGNESFIFVAENLWYDKNPYINNPINISDYKDEAKIKIYDETLPRAKYTQQHLESFRKYHFHDTGKNSPFTKTSHIENDIYFLYEQGNNLAAFLYTIKNQHPLNYKLIIKTIQSIAPFFNDFYFQPNENNYLKLQWQDKYTSTIYGVNDFSDGTLRFIALTTLFLQPNLPKTIIIDEPELGLHPFAIAKLAGMIQSAAAKHSQIIIATQSTELLNHFKPEDVITVDQKDGETVFKRLKEDELKIWLEDYSLGDLWKRNIIQSGQPF